MSRASYLTIPEITERVNKDWKVRGVDSLVDREIERLHYLRKAAFVITYNKDAIACLRSERDASKKETKAARKSFKD